MSLEYAIEYRCRMRDEHGESVMRGLARTFALISRMVSDSIRSQSAPSEESVQFTSRYADELERAEAIAEYCRTSCPVRVSGLLDSHGLNARSEPIECLGRIRYPIEARFERFLADRLQLIHDTTPEHEWPNLLRILLDPESPFDGEATKQLRTITTDDGLRFYELRLPVGLPRLAPRLTTDHVFDILAGFTSTDGGDSSYQREIPPLALGDYADFLEATLFGGMTEDEMGRLIAQGSSFVEFMRFAAAVRAAEGLGVRVLLD